MLLLLLKFIFLLIFGLTGVKGKVLSLLLFVELLLADWAVDVCCWCVETCAVCCCCFGEVAGVKIPKLTRLGIFVLPESSLFEELDTAVTRILLFVLFVDPISIFLPDVLLFTKSGTNFINLFGFRADDIACVAIVLDGADVETVNAFTLSKLVVAAFNVISPKFAGMVAVEEFDFVCIDPDELTTNADAATLAAAAVTIDDEPIVAVDTALLLLLFGDSWLWLLILLQLPPPDILDGLSDLDWDNDDSDVEDDVDGDVAADNNNVVDDKLLFSVSVDALLCATIEWFLSPCDVL